MAQTLATATAILKEYYEPPLRKQLDNRKILLNRLEKSTDGISNEVGGKYVTFPIHVKRNKGIGSRNEMEDLPVAGRQGTVAARIGLKYDYGSMALSGQALKLVNTNYQSFVKALELETTGLKDDLLKDVNRKLYGNGTGAFASTDTTTAGNDFHVVSGFQFVQEDMEVDVWTTAQLASPTGTPKATGRTVDAIDDSTETITLSGASISFATGDVLTRAGSANREITGLDAIINDTGTLYNIDPSNVRQWKAVVDSNGGTERNLTESLLIQNADAVYRNGGMVSVMVTSLGVRRAYFNLLSQQRKVVNKMDLEGGFTGLAFTTDNGEIPLVSDVDAPNNIIWGIDEKRLTIYRESPWSFMDEDGSMWYRMPGTAAGSIKDGYSATMFQYWELGADRRNTHFKIEDVKEA